LKTALKSGEETIMLKKEFDQMQLEKREFDSKINQIIFEIQEEKKNLNNSLARRGFE